LGLALDAVPLQRLELMREMLAGQLSKNSLVLATWLDIARGAHEAQMQCSRKLAIQASHILDAPTPEMVHPSPDAEKHLVAQEHATLAAAQSRLQQVTENFVAFHHTAEKLSTRLSAEVTLEQITSIAPLQLQQQERLGQLAALLEPSASAAAAAAVGVSLATAANSPLSAKQPHDEEIAEEPAAALTFADFSQLDSTVLGPLRETDLASNTGYETADSEDAAEPESSEPVLVSATQQSIGQLLQAIATLRDAWETQSKDFATLKASILQKRKEQQARMAAEEAAIAQKLATATPEDQETLLKVRARLAAGEVAAKKLMAQLKNDFVRVTAGDRLADFSVSEADSLCILEDIHVRLETAVANRADALAKFLII
jgi:hypothetical protein